MQLYLNRNKLNTIRYKLTIINSPALKIVCCDSTSSVPPTVEQVTMLPFSTDISLRLMRVVIRIPSSLLTRVASNLISSPNVVVVALTNL